MPWARSTRPRRSPAIADAEPAVGAEEDQRPIVRPDRGGQARDLLWAEEAHLLAVNLGQRHPAAGRPRDHAGVDGGGHDLAEQLVGALHRRGCEAAGAQLGDPGSHIVLADLGPLYSSDDLFGFLGAPAFRGGLFLQRHAR
jgi:hypothetical protein